MMTTEIIMGDCLDVLLLLPARALPLLDGVAQVVATSPPYFQQRKYATGANASAEIGREALHDCAGWASGASCGECYICHLRAVAAEVYRILHPSGVFFMNLGDGWASRKVGGIGPKDLYGNPYRAALAFQADGWVWRSHAIWNPPNKLPGSQLDRTTADYESVLMFTRQRRGYYFDEVDSQEEAAQRPHSFHKARPNAAHGFKRKGGKMNGLHVPGQSRAAHRSDRTLEAPSPTRTMRSVWAIPTKGYGGGHFAVWPPKLVERLIRLGSPEYGVCPICRAPWRRVMEKGEPEMRSDNPNEALPYRAGGVANHGRGGSTLHMVRERRSVGWAAPGCGHVDPGGQPLAPRPALIVDPFCGTATTLQVARELGALTAADLISVDEGREGQKEAGNGRHSFGFIRSCRRHVTSRAAAGGLEDSTAGDLHHSLLLGGGLSSRMVERCDYDSVYDLERADMVH